MSKSLLITIEDAAAFVGVGRDMAYRLVESGEWPSEKFGKRKRLIPRSFLISRYGMVNVAAESSTDEATS